MTPEELHAWYDDYLDVCNRHDLAGVRGLLHPEVRRAGAPAGADAWVEDLADLLVGFPDYRWKRIALVVEGDRVAAHLRTRGTHRGPFQGVRPTGRHVSVGEFAFYRVVGGRITEYAGTGDEGGLLARIAS